ncbi:hypothetical protein NJC10_03400 [Micrococcus sp. M4NT]|uniref:acyl-CoA carboxylase epsilon subunit n=1 Tax=Micrococcus sp. M4NT TaxID=2957501 RepID=UPI0029A8760D|nr:acyl-CoA carboxylase epsilon subunit [Micrococcus sp. M4NT]MDX2340724.1 hypothetical protein [Micrococcus sp. M4NT]
MSARDEEVRGTGQAGGEQAGDAGDAVRLSGAELDPEEMAALTAVLAHLRAEEAQAVQARPRPPRLDRTLRRRDDLGLWARPGKDQWRRSAGPS